MNERDREEQQPVGKPGPLQVVASVLAAAFGVQSSRNRERDFKHGKARNYIIAGLVFTVLFVVVIFALVQLIVERLA